VRKRLKQSLFAIVISGGFRRKGEIMTKTMMALATAATLAVTAIAAPAPAEAHWRGRGGGALIGGLALGAIAGAAIASSRPGYGYGYEPGYYAPGPAYYGPSCYMTRERFWDGYGWRVRRVQVC
jgi:hypothetical protein